MTWKLLPKVGRKKWSLVLWSLYVRDECVLDTKRHCLSHFLCAVALCYVAFPPFLYVTVCHTTAFPKCFLMGSRTFLKSFVWQTLLRLCMGLMACMAEAVAFCAKDFKERCCLHKKQFRKRNSFPYMAIHDRLHWSHKNSHRKSYGGLLEK